VANRNGRQLGSNHRMAVPTIIAAVGKGVDPIGASDGEHRPVHRTVDIFMSRPRSVASRE
jgi:hypothetical protein